MKEVEVRAIIAPGEKQRIIEELQRRGFRLEPEQEQIDIVLDHPDASLFRSGRKIRLRLEDGRAELTYKGPFQGDKHASRRDEITVPLAAKSTDDIIQIFEALGFPVCFRIRKKRLTLRHAGVSVTFDEWPILGCLMEIEGAENEVRDLAATTAQGVAFANYRLKELFHQREQETGRPLSELKTEYESRSGDHLGQLELLIS